jgi:hypothetical protein
LRPKTDKQVTEVDLTEEKYTEYLERFADMKCSEVDRLIARLLKRRRKIMDTQKRLARIDREKARNQELIAENESLKTQLDEIKGNIRQYLIRHRASRAEIETKELKKIASIRAEAERRNIELYAFILSQLRQFIDGSYDVDEESARRLVIKAASRMQALGRR